MSAMDGLVLLLVVAGAVGYAIALGAARHRGRWPALRTLCWYAGLVCAGAGMVSPVAAAAHTSFTAHMAGHLLLGMLAPLLLVLAAPITVVLRALPVDAARALSRVLRTWFVRTLTRPIVAATLNAGGLWALYATPVYHLMHHSMLLHVVVHAHMFVAGCLFTASLVSPDPMPHRASFWMRSSVLIVYIAAHSILAKWLYAHPPAGVGLGDGQAGAQLMYYGGDVVDVALIVLLFAGWYAAARPRAPRVTVPIVTATDG
ncbi:cytochrome c oxidase assembly protein [Citricoccus sp. GCM10030269]|uniref:cytochrome c oxidase assembly protein n=1 Tax=Citricoccus sp. GCM10030269 TaxID=3273388 RepID=UPI00361349BE